MTNFIYLHFLHSKMQMIPFANALSRAVVQVVFQPLGARISRLSISRFLTYAAALMSVYVIGIFSYR